MTSLLRKKQRHWPAIGALNSQNKLLCSTTMHGPWTSKSRMEGCKKKETSMLFEACTSTKMAFPFEYASGSLLHRNLSYTTSGELYSHRTSTDNNYFSSHIVYVIQTPLFTKLAIGAIVVNWAARRPKNTIILFLLSNPCLQNVLHL